MILVFGASSAIAKKVIPELAKFDDVVATYHSSPIDFYLENVECIQLDLTNDSSIESICNSVCEQYSNIVFINFASISINNLFLNTTMKDWNETFSINLFSSVKALKMLTKKMISDKWGRIIFISSYLSNKGAVGASAYSSSKSAIKGLSQTISSELARFNITSNELCLGYFEDGMIDSVPEARLSAIRNRIPSKRFGESKEISLIIKNLIDSNYINGSEIQINGGLT